MSIVVNIYYTGTNGVARKFAEEMESSGAAEAIYKKIKITFLTFGN